MTRLMVLVTTFRLPDVKIIVPRRLFGVYRASSPDGMDEGRLSAGVWRLSPFSAAVFGYTWMERHGQW